MKNQRCLALDGPMLERFTRHEPHDLVRRAANRLQHGKRQRVHSCAIGLCLSGARLSASVAPGRAPKRQAHTSRPPVSRTRTVQLTK